MDLFLFLIYVGGFGVVCDYHRTQKRGWWFTLGEALCWPMQLGEYLGKKALGL